MKTRRTRRSFVGQQRPAFVVPPLAADAQVARRKSLPTKAQPPHRRDTTRVVRLDVRLQPMQALFAEAVRHVQLDRLKFRVNFLPEEGRQFRRDGVYLLGVRYWSPPCAGCRT